MISSVCVPIEPVEPSTDTEVVIVGSAEHEGVGGEPDRRQHEEQPVEAVEQASVAGRIVPMSLMPRSRLICDSARSPIGAASAAAMPITIIVNNPLPSKASPASGAGCPMMPMTMAAISTTTMPPMRPSMVLLGLADDSGVRPSASR